MNFYMIGYSGYEESAHLTLIGDVEITEEDFKDAVRDAFREVSLKEIADHEHPEIKWASAPFFGSHLGEIAEIVAARYGLEIVEEKAKIHVNAWEYEFSKQAGDALVSKFTHTDESPFFSREYEGLKVGKTPKHWELMRSQD